MTREIQPGWIEAFAAKKMFLKSEYLNANGLDEDGTKAVYIGALPLIQSPMAIRPDHNESWEMQVLAKNLEAEKEFEEETGIEIDDALDADSNTGCEQACRLLTKISAHAKDQDNPIFIPIRNGNVIEVRMMPAGRNHPAGHEFLEVFSCVKADT